MNIFNNPIFLQSAGNSKRFEGIRATFNIADPVFKGITGTGNIVFRSIKDGEVVVQVVNNPDNDSVSVQADSGTMVIVEGKVTEFTQSNDPNLVSLDVESTTLTMLSCATCYALTKLDLITATALTTLNCANCSEIQELNLTAATALMELNCIDCYALQELNLTANTELTTLNCASCSEIQELNLSANTKLTTLDCHSCYALTTLDLSMNTALTTLECTDLPDLQSLNLSKNTELTTLNCANCYALTTLDLSTNTALTTLDCTSCEAIRTIFYPATNSAVSTSIAGLITNAGAETGTLYTNSDADYYATLETAANNKGWSIQPLAA